MERVSIPNPPFSGEELATSLQWLGLVAASFNRASKAQGNLEIDLSQIRFSNPFSTLPLAALSLASQQDRRVQIRPPEDENCRAYLKAIQFPEGGRLKPGRSYSPVLRWAPEDDTDVAAALYAFFREEMGGGDFSIDSVIYPFSELWDNIANHAESDSGWCQWQYYPADGRLDVCVLDRGISFAGAYRTAGQELSDREAVVKALDGVSTKGGRERGFGLRTSVRLITASAFNGRFCCISGSAGFEAGPGDGTPRLFDLPWTWKGTLIMFRFFKAKVDLYHYVEG
ncbi:MAG: hypothetical protein ACYCW6_13940 [Candidatus Xenobia bacterium]